MFLSKIWFFLVAVAAATALTIALVMPRPAEREALKEEKRLIKDSCAVVNILLEQNARTRIDLATAFARAGKVPEILDAASKSKAISIEQNGTARTAANALIASVKDDGGDGDSKAKPSITPDFVILVDRSGRVVSRAGPGDWEKKFGDSIKGYALVDDALAGFVRDDLWFIDSTLYRVAASPVVYRQQWAGAVLLGHDLDRDFATRLAKQLPVEVSFYAGSRPVGTSHPVQIHSDVVEAAAPIHTAERARAEDCRAEPFTVRGGGKDYSVLAARLPGEAGRFSKAFYSVFLERPSAIGFSGTLGAVKKDDLKMGTFPWIQVAILFLVVVALGIALMMWEADRPLRRLAADAVALAKGETDRLAEDKHRGKYGSIARSVNIQLDKTHREAKAARKDLDQLLGPAPSGPMDSAASGPAAASLPLSGPGGPSAPGFAAPPPSAFKFSDGTPASAQDAPSAPFDLDLPPPPPAMASTEPAARSGSKSAQIPVDKQIPPRPVALPGAGEAPPPVPKPPPLPGKSNAPKAPKAPKAINEDILASTDDEPAAAAAPAPVAAPKRRGSAFDEEPTTVADPSTALLQASAQRDDDSSDGADYFRKVFDEFIALKKKCGEPIGALTFQKFASKLEKNRAALIAKHGCKEVKFQVYVKDGKAALKASPVKG